MPLIYDAAVSHERTPASEHNVRPARAYLVLDAHGRIVATNDPTEGTPVGLHLVAGRLVPDTPVPGDAVVIRRYGARITV